MMRGLLIALGAQLIVAFHWIIFIFGAFLIFTGVKMLVMINAKPDLANNWLLRVLRRHIRVTDEYHQEKFFIRRDGLLWATPLFLALVLIEFADLVFALDSIPAILAITQDPFIVYTSNVFAILGLRALCFALANIIHQYHYLKYGLSLVLVVVGGKMIVNGVFDGKVVPTEVALAITVTLILGSIVLSLIKTRDRVEPRRPTPVGSPEALRYRRRQQRRNRREPVPRFPIATTSREYPACNVRSARAASLCPIVRIVRSTTARSVAEVRLDHLLPLAGARNIIDNPEILEIG